MNNTINTAAVLSFFTGKSLVNAKAALDTLSASVEAGEWLPGSRTVRAALNKSTVAKKAARKHEEAQKASGWTSTYDRDPVVAKRKSALWEMLHAMEFGGRPRVEVEAVTNPQGYEVVLVADYAAYKAAFAPVFAAIEQLDNTIPKPVITKQNASPTVTANINALGATDIGLCPVEWVLVEEDGRFHHEMRLLWPEGTVHGTSRYAGPCQCQACGHKISNGYNWVPMVLTTSDGPKSLWVGRDCAKTLFGFEVKGEMVIQNGKA